MSEREPAGNAERLRQVKKAYESLTRSPNGKIVLADIRERWVNTQVTGRNEFETVVRAAQKDIAQTILNFAENKIDD